MRHPSELLQGLATSSRSMMSKASLLPGALDFTYRAVIRVVIFVVGLMLIWAAGKAMFGNDIVIEPISVPRKLEEDGYSGAVVSRRLLAEVQAIRKAGETQELGDDRDAKVRFRSSDEFATLTTLQVPSSSLSLRSVTLALQDFLDIPEQKISGAITIRRPDPDKPAVVYTVSLLLGPAAGLSAKPEEDANLDEAIRLSARSIAREYDPVGLAAYYLERGDSKELEKLAEALIETREWQRRKDGLFIRGLYEDKLLEKVSFYQQAIDEDPRFSAAYNAWGRALAKESKTDEAIEKYGEAIRLNPSNASAFRNRAIAYKSKSQYQLAIADFEQAGKLEPAAETFVQLGYTYEWLDKFDPAIAIKAYDQAVRLDPRSHWALNNRCYMKAALKDRSAIADCDKALLLKKFYEIYDSRGFAYLMLGEFDKAIVDYDEALRLHENPYSRLGRGVALRGKGDLAGGDADIARAERQDGEIKSKMKKMRLVVP